MKNPAKTRRIRTACLIVLLAATPFLRSCGDVSYGFPFVAIEADSPYAVKNIRPFLLLFNITIVSMVVFATAFLLRGKRLLLSGGFQGVFFYSLATWLGFLVIYPLSEFFKPMEFVAGIYLYFLYPFYAFAYDLHLLLPSTVEKSRFFGDADDMPLRLIYFMMLAIWFMLGHLRIRLIKHRKLPETRVD